MIYFFSNPNNHIFAASSSTPLDQNSIEKLNWVLNANLLSNTTEVSGNFIGPRASMLTPWSTNATDILKNMGIFSITRVEEYLPTSDQISYDPMLMQKYDLLNQDLFKIDVVSDQLEDITDIENYNKEEGLALSQDEIDYLNQLSKELGRPLTDAEVFGFSQVNSEHCRHKIFNGSFILNNEEQSDSLFALIKKTAKTNPNEIVSAYKDNVAFINGPKAIQFAPKDPEKASLYTEQETDTILSLKAETHNFPTTVEPFNGAATGSGGEIRDRLAGGQGSIPLAGTAVYMTSYPRTSPPLAWEQKLGEKKWLYQNPTDILIKASNGASDFGNKFGQPLIAGSLLTFEHHEEAADFDQRHLGFDKVIMLAGGVGYGLKKYAFKKKPKKGDLIVILGGDNYRIGMGGAAVSSADTGAFNTALELNAVQRSNPEMQKRVANTIRALVERTENPIVSIHDHGAGGHLNCLSELVEDTGGKIDINKLPIGDPTLSEKEIIGNESQERMGLIIDPKDEELLRTIAEREQAPMFIVGEVTEDMHFEFAASDKSKKAIDLELSGLFGNSPKTIITDSTTPRLYEDLSYQIDYVLDYLENVLQLEAVACKDWLTNKVDRCVGGKVAIQQCVGELQLPLNNCGVMALDYVSRKGIATSIGHSPISGLINPIAGSQNSIAEALTNIIWAPLEKGIQSVSLSANWMWPCNNEGEDERLYKAVQAASDFAIELGINIPTGKDSLSMKQKYSDKEVLSPGTVIISAAGQCSDFTKVIEPVGKLDQGSLYYINLSQEDLALGGSSFAQSLNAIGQKTSGIASAKDFAQTFDFMQEGIKTDKICAGHDISSGGLITCLLEMCFSTQNLGAEIDLSELGQADFVKLLFAENSGILVQLTADSEHWIKDCPIAAIKIGQFCSSETLAIKNNSVEMGIPVARFRDLWYTTSYRMDELQTANGLAKDRFENYKNQPLRYTFPTDFDGEIPSKPQNKPLAGVLRDKGSNSEREMANALYLAGFEVKDIHMTDLISGKENLEDIQLLAAVGGFSNSDVLGSAKGWAGAFKFNANARAALDAFFNRPDTLSIGICNGCQLFMELELIYPEHEVHGKMIHNKSNKHESNFIGVKIEANNSVMLSNMEGCELGVWVSHGEGNFRLPESAHKYNVVSTYSYDAYPANPNGSDLNAAMLCDASGRHLVSMPHMERSIFSWNWAHYPDGDDHRLSPWIKAFENARNWILNS